MSDEENPSVVSGPRAMWLTRADVDKEAQWSQNKKQIEKPGYSYVRHTTDEYVSGVRNASDGYAWGAMQLNLTDLRSAMGNTDAGFDDTEIQKELAAQAQKIQNNTSEINKLKTDKADKGHTHDDLVGGIYDDSWIQPALNKKSDTTHGHANYSETNHQHDTTHNHDKEYQAKGDYAAEIHGHIEYETKTDANIVHDALTESIAKKADSRHEHDGSYAPFVHEHALESHGHDDKYQAKGDYASDVHFHDEYAESNDLSSLEIKLDTEINDREAADEALGIKLDEEAKKRKDGDDALQEEVDGLKTNLENHQHAGGSGAHVGTKPPQRPTEGDLWFLSDLYLAEGEIPIELSPDKLFVFADGKWEPATSLQHERRMREYGDKDTLGWAEEHANRSDAKYMTRIDKVLLPDPVFVNKGVVEHINGTIPPFNDDKVHFSNPISKRDSSIAYKGEDPGPGIVYAIMSHDTNYPSPRREEWIVKEVNYNNGIVTIVASDPYGNTNAHSENLPCTLWLLTEDDAKGDGGVHEHNGVYLPVGDWGGEIGWQDDKEILDYITIIEKAQKFTDNLQNRRIDELEARLDAFEELMKPWSGIDIGTYATKTESYEPTGSTQAEGTGGMWWTNVSMNTTPNNHVRIGMQGNPDLCTQIAAMPVPFEMDVIQPGAKQTWHVYEVYERASGVLHFLNDSAWGDPMTHSHIAVDTQYIVRKV